MPKTHDVDSYPTVCCVCEKPIVKARHDSQHYTDVATSTATSWHTTCSKNTHPFYCKGQKTTIELVLGSWFCATCGEKIEWAVT